MTETPPEQTLPEPPATPEPPTPPKAERTGFAVYDTAELRFLDGVFPSAKAARDAHKDGRVEGRKYEVREV